MAYIGLLFVFKSNLKLKFLVVQKHQKKCLDIDILLLKKRNQKSILIFKK